MSISCVAERRPNIVLFPSKAVGFQEDEDNNQKIKSIDLRQKRYSLETKASFVFYMLRREEEVKSNLSWYAQDNGVSRTCLYKLAKDFKSGFGEWKPGPKGRDEAVYLCVDVRHQFDLFHFKRDAHRLLRRLEAMAYQKIELEYKAQVKMG